VVDKILSYKSFPFEWLEAD